MTQTKLNLTSW